MNIALGFACLVTVAFLIGENVADTKTCPCEFIPSKTGCKLGTRIQPIAGKVCRCKIHDISATNPECTGEYVNCWKPHNTNCTTNENTYGHCMQGNYKGHGDCCGYDKAVAKDCLDNVRGLQQNTRLFGQGNLVGGAIGAAQQGFQQRPPGFNQGFHGQGVRPVGGFPGQGFQQQGFPGQGFQQQGFPGQGFQQQGFPGQGFQQQGFPGQGFQQQGFPSELGQVNPIGTGVSCRRWCRTPQGQAYCCENANQPLSAAVTKPGQCPPVRPQCPPIRFILRPCSSDGGCPGTDKCCFDTCLQHHTCKPPIGAGK